MNRLFSFLQKASPYHTIGILKEKVNNLIAIMRPMAMDPRTFANEPIPEYPYRPSDLYQLSKYSDTLTIVQTTIREELFRNGVELLEADKTDSDTTTAEDEVGTNLGQRESLLEQIEDCNENHQTLIDVCKEMEDDINIIDDAYGLFLFEYGYNNQGAIVAQKLLEFISASPLYMKPVMNRQYRHGFDDDNNEIKFCPACRNKEHRGGHEKKCLTCGKELIRVAYRYTSGTEYTYYSWDEVVHVSKYRPSKALGFSPVMTLWQKTKILIAQDSYMLEAYEGKRSPRQMVIFNTPNRDSLKASWDDMLERTKHNPHQPAIMGLEQGIGQNQKDSAQMFEFMRSMEEMQFSETRKEIRTQIGAVYGVEPVFQGDISASSGLNNEGLQITVTNRAAERGQAIYNDKVYPRYLKALQVEGWVIKLRSPEEQDEMAKLERQQFSLQNGQIATQLGLEAEYDSDKDEVVIKDGDLQPPAPPSFGGFGSSGFGTEAQPNSVLPNAPDSAPEPKPPKATGTPATPKKTAKSIEKADTQQPRVMPIVPPFSMLANRLKREIQKLLHIYKKKPTEQQLRTAVDKMKTGLQEELSLAVNRSFDTTYMTGKDSVEKEIGVNLSFGKVDEQTLMVLKNQPVLYESYAGLTRELVEKVNDVISDAYHSEIAPSAKSITEALKNHVQLADSRAENIARTESAKVMNAARRNAYLQDDPTDDAMYLWIGPDDHRTTETSKNIKQQVGNGQSWHDLVKTIEVESAKAFPKWTVNKEFPVSHYQSRHTFLRIPGVTKAVARKNEELNKTYDKQLEFVMKKKEMKLLDDKLALVKKLEKGVQN